MIPYFELQRVFLGPIPIQVWGTFVALGILLGAFVSARFAKRQGLESDVIYRGATWLIVAAFLGARVLHVVAYDPHYYASHLLEILAFWHGGFSIIGGFLGAMAGYVLFVWRTKINWVRYTDAFLYGLPLGMGCGRIGCFLIHDHPGTLTHFVLGVRYPDGTVHHDLGLYESLHSFALAALFAFLYWRKKDRQPMFYACVFLLWYGTIRFWLDFYRLVDVTYAGLTPAQYASIAMIAGGIFLFARGQKSAN